MKKRIIAYALCIALCASLLCGCELSKTFDVLESVWNTASESIGILQSVPEGINEIREENDRNTVLQDGGIFRFYGSNITEKSEIQLYNNINAAISTLSPSVDVITGDINRLLEIVNYVHNDHPEYFWFTDGSEIKGYEKGGRYYVTLSFNYNTDAETAVVMKSKLEAVCAPVIERLKDLDEYGKVKGVYEYVIKSSSYDEYSGDQSCYTLLTKGRGVCAGYASAASYLLNRLGVDNIYVYGSSKGQEHAWNLVKIEGNWLQLDLTWGDPVTDDGTQRISWQYFLLSDREMLKNHSYDKEIPTLPQCSSEDYGYYVKEGRLLDTADTERVYEMLADAVSKGEALEFRCTEKLVYSKINELLFSGYGIWDIIGRVYEQYPVFDGEHISYYCDGENYMVLISPVYN